MTLLAGLGLMAGTLGSGFAVTPVAAAAPSAYEPCAFLDEAISCHLDQGNNDYAATLAHIGNDYGCGFAI